MIHYRWATVVMTGKWCTTREKALRDALSAGQAEEVAEGIRLQEFAWLEYGDPSDPQQLVQVSD
jgi:hypothetical protein